MPVNYNPESDEEILQRFAENFALTAGIQGRIAYLFMSVHAANPNLIKCVTSTNPSLLLYSNMVYGISILIYSRPNMKCIGFLNRVAFRWASKMDFDFVESVLGSLMFNYASVGLFTYFRESFPDKPRLCVGLGFLAGRFLMLHLLAYLYHVDIRSHDRSIPRNSAFDAMYIN